MSCNCRFWTLLLATLLCSCGACKDLSIPIQDDVVNVLIMGKHRLKEAKIYFRHAEIFVADKTIPVSNQLLTVYMRGNSVVFRIGMREYSSDYLNISSDGGFSVTRQSAKGTETLNYTGSLRVFVHEGCLYLVNRTPLEDYVHGAAVSELGNQFYPDKNSDDPSEKALLMAMEVAVRTYVLHYRDRHDSPEYQFCDLTHCVYFAGIKSGEKSLTPGEVMLDGEKKFVTAYFHSTCGGELGGPESYWDTNKQDECFRRGKDRVARGPFLCENSPHFKWTAFVPDSKMNKIVGRDVSQIGVVLHENSRVRFLMFTDRFYDTWNMAVSDFLSRAGRTLGWNVIKSNYFTVQKYSSGWKFTGHGLGHGIGLCQWGAASLAKQGYSYQQILDFYYPGFTPGKVKFPDEGK